MLDVLAGLGARERFQVVTRGDSLGELTEIDPREHGAQLGLSDQEDLQQLVIVRLQVREQTDLLQHLAAQVLRFIDDENGAPTRGVRIEKVPIESIHERLGRRDILGQPNAKLLADAL